MVVESMSVDIGKIGFGSHTSLFVVTLLDSQRSDGEVNKNLFLFSLGGYSGTLCPPLGQLESIGSSQLIGWMGIEKYFHVPKIFGC